MKKPFLLNLLINTTIDHNQDQTVLPQQYKNIEKMADTSKIYQDENSTFNMGFDAPDGMQWDQYGNPEFIGD
jgi:hypothetical protein